MDAAFELGGDDAAAAADDDAAAEARELEHCVAGVVEKRPHRRVEPEEFADERLDGGVFVLVDEFGDGLREVLVIEHFADEVFVENHPWLLVGLALRVELAGEEVGDGFRAAACLAREGDERRVGRGPDFGAIFLAEEVGAVFGEVIGFGHGGSLSESPRVAEGGSLIRRRN